MDLDEKISITLINYSLEEHFSEMKDPKIKGLIIQLQNALEAREKQLEKGK